VEAQAELLKAREDVRASTTRKIEGLEKDVAELRARAEKKLSKDEVDSMVRELQDKSEAVRRSLRDLDAATSTNLDQVKKGVDKRVQELDRAIQEAKRRV
jgi:ABC-type transporter Mla subunit MlaD